VYLPNFISVFRLFLAPFIIWLIASGNMLGAFAVFIVAGLSDAADGFIARRFNMQTELGAYLDPIADKALLMSSYLALGFLNYLPLWLTILVVSRDVLIIGAVMLSWLMGRPIEVRPSKISKFNTVMQIALAVLVLAEHGMNLGLAAFMVPMIWATGATTALSAALYLVTWLRYMATYDINGRNTPPGPRAEGTH
jgi:cardiolipin synthase (CMP-forming)